VETPASLGIIAGSGAYPLLLAESARRAGVGKIVAAAFTGETDPALANCVDAIEWLRVGQLSRLLKFLESAAFITPSWRARSPRRTSSISGPT
jgi:DUF1009 family protein